MAGRIGVGTSGVDDDGRFRLDHWDKVSGRDQDYGHASLQWCDDVYEA
jgi:hypothetical protein